MKLLTISLISFFFFYQHQVDNSAITVKTIVTDTSKYAVMSAGDPARFLAFKGNLQPATLSVTEINTVDSILNAFIATQNRQIKNFPIHSIHHYFKQLVACTNEKGEKVVWINCLCSVDNDPDWRKRIIYVLDGGSCYFQLKVNLHNKTAYEFGVNGDG